MIKSNLPDYISRYRMDYNEWNIAIARHFFNVGKGGKEVLLFVNEEKIDAIGSVQNARVTDFIGAMKKEAESTKGYICKRALQLYEGWRKAGYEYPPYIAYLALFVLASTTEGDFDPKAYYPRYWKLIDEPDEGTPAGFYETVNLWDDLEKWSVEDKKEELGRFKSRIRGKWCHVGRPLSQTLLSDDERKELPGIFSDCGFDPTNIPSEDIIKKGLIHQGSKRLRHRTLTLLKSQEGDNQEFINALLDLTITELEGWGKYEIPLQIVGSPAVDAQLTPKEKEREKAKEKEKDKETPPPPSFFRTCIELDDPKQRALICLRLKTVRPYPDNGLEFKVGSKILTCTETVPVGWSTKLLEIPGNTPFDPSGLNWLEDWKFVDSENGWSLTYKKSNIRVFLPGDEEGIPEFIESQKLSRDCEFRIVCHESIAKSIKEWGQKSCKSFSELTYSGIPRGWTLFKGTGATEPCQGIDVLGLSNLLRIQLEGGIGIGHGNLYLSFAPPRVKIEGGLGNEKLLLNGIEIEKSPTKICWELKNAPIGRPLNIQISRDGDVLPEWRVIQLVEPSINIESTGSAPKRDCKGNVIKGEAKPDYASGALVVSSKHGDIESLDVLPTSLSKRLIFIGQVAGQVSRWPSEGMPSVWIPVWGLYRTSRKKWATHFCRQNVAEGLAPIVGGGYSAKDLKAWKEALWVMRKRTRPPELPALAKLWTKYMEAAKNI
jgi:hypothetical protein